MTPRLSRVRCAAVAVVASLVVAATSAGAAQQTVARGTARPVVPGAAWDSIANPRVAGWSRTGLDSVRAKLRTMATTGFVAVVGGRILMSYGNTDTVTYLASVRKSVLSMLIGNYVTSGAIDLNRTLAQLGMDDVGGLTDREKEATFGDLISARSGVYHAASNEGDDLASAPPRGSQRHGTYYLYSNWDFNAAGGAFERMTGKAIFDALETDLARPIGMQDFNRAQHRMLGDATRSRYLAYHMHFSTRDMARLGLLMLRRGRWGDTQVIPADWVDESTRAITPVTAMNPPYHRRGPFGYGYLWWVWDGPSNSGAFRNAYAGQGAFGQYIVIMPALDLVVAHKTAPGQRGALGRPRVVGSDELLEVLAMLARAHCGERCRN